MFPAGYLISADPALLNIDVIHEFISQSYWAKGMPKPLVEKMVANSLSFGVYHYGKQVGFARIVTDRTTFAYLADVFILPDHRGRGLSKMLMKTILAHPDLQGLRRWMLVTLDAHGLYESFGFRTAEHPERHMEIHHSGLYEKQVPESGADVTS